jgi:N-acetylglutamate synthase-like GNAT family acetyltransferase
MKIRRYQTGEEEAIWEIYFRATHETNSKDYHPDLLHRWAPEDKDMSEWRNRLAEMKPWIALIEDEIAGMAELEERGFINYFYVLPEFQSRGIGSALLKKIESEATKMGLTSVFADVSLTAKSFFEQRGFVVTEARANVILGHPAPNYCMSKELRNSEQGACTQPSVAKAPSGG